ncbi:hypothetical protein DFR86_00985 [Acidianus sulfidivorans JP7]|uniref:Uncharacterized protein n=1 Tax=Acidianus sulfidivorans JP7 TaxID=619593 RepID=A0A2U9IJW7_9CREN|nr:hypothetical protein [Acidianus sulfidivorans]AWR96256.1 hypothetical protein DFR86_00985 [Acidianus sulfidivorans JP7]
MKKTTTIALILAVTVSIAGLIAYSVISYDLLNLTFSIQQSSAIVSTANLDLGTLSPGSGGSVSTSTTITINTGRVYAFYLVDYQELMEEFSTFLVTISFSNSTQSTSITLGWPNGGFNDTVYLAPGTYNLQITLQYYVYSNATSMSFSGQIVDMGYN